MSRTHSRPAIWMFGGQGSQYYRMGHELYVRDVVFRRAVDACSELLEPVLHVSLIDEIYRPRAGGSPPFDRLLYSTPAICAVQYGIAEVLRARGFAPDYVLGYSLGSITARVVAGLLSLEDGLRVAVQLAELTEAGVSRGGMLAVLKEPEEYAGTWLAARNFATHFVVAGPDDALAAVERRLQAGNVTIQRLAVRYPFHCPLIDPIEREFTSFVASRRQTPADVDVLGADSIWQAVREPIDFAATVAGLEARGPYRYIDVGPSGTLATFVKYNLRPGSASETATTVTPFDQALYNFRDLEAAEALDGGR